MASFPALFSGSVSLYPLTQAIQIGVEVLQYSDYTEQRWVEHAPLRRFVLSFEQISKADRDSIQTFFESVKGGFDKTWDITIAGVVYSYMVFLTDTFECREVEPEHWSFTLACGQTRKT